MPTRQQISVVLDEKFLSFVAKKKKDIPERLKELSILELYRRKEISSGKAAELLGMERFEFVRYASRLGIPFFDMSKEELERDLEAAKKEVFGRRKLPPFVKYIEISGPIALKVLESNLEAGESEAICLYEEIDANLLIIDDLEGRRVAERLGINITGTLGILLLAKREKFIDAIK